MKYNNKTYRKFIRPKNSLGGINKLFLIVYPARGVVRQWEAIAS